jgi:hypothetical protein
VQSLTAEIAVSGSVGGQRVRAHLVAGATASAARLEAVAPFGAPLFIFVADGRDGTLYFPRDARVVEHGAPAQLLEAVAGVPLEASDLLPSLTGCAPADRLSDPQAIGEQWRTASGAAGEKVYLRRERTTDRWRLVAVVHGTTGSAGSWRAEYDDFRDGLPRVVRFASADQRRFAIQLALSQVETNVALGPEAFRVDVPRDAERITVDELRRSGPLAQTKSHDDGGR